MQARLSHQSWSWLGVITWVLALLFFQYEFFLRAIINSFSSSMSQSLHLSNNAYTSIAIAYTISYGLMQIPVGHIIDRFGYKWPMILSILICALSTLSLAFAHSPTSAFISRFFTGLGSSFAFVCLLVVLRRWFSLRHFGFLAGVSQFIGTLGPMFAGGPLAYTIHALHSTWRGATITIAWFGFALAMCCFVFLSLKRKAPTHSASSPAPRNHLSIRQSLNVLFRNKQVWWIALFTGASYASVAMMGIFWGQKFLLAKGLSNEQAGTAISLCWIGYAIGCPLLGFISDRLKNRTCVMLASTLLGLICTGFLVLPFPIPLWLLQAYCIGIGMAASGQNLGFAIIAEHASPATQATALGLNNGMISVFDLITPFWISTALSISTHTTPVTAQDFSLGFSIMPLFYLAAALIVIFKIKETHCKPMRTQRLSASQI